MGGFGSGRWYRYGKTTATDDVKNIDVRLLRKWGCLPNNCDFHSTRVGTLSWSRGDQPTGSVRYEITYWSLALRFSYQRGDEPWQDINQTVRFDRTTCSYGGVRLWFLCPHCGTRVAVLYGAGARFHCRHGTGYRTHLSMRPTSTGCTGKRGRSEQN
jgi:hypothetical protein